MLTWFKDFCAVMGFVTEYHPWWVDYAARINIRLKEDEEKFKEIQKLVRDRARELEKPNDQ